MDERRRLALRRVPEPYCRGRRQRHQHQQHGAPQQPATLPRAPMPPQYAEAGEHALDHHRIFDLKRKADQRHGGQSPPCAAAQDQQHGERDRRIVEYRRLPALPAEPVQQQDIGKTGSKRAAAPADHLGDPHDQPAGRDHRDQRQRLIGPDRPGIGQRRRRQVQGKQPDWLAIPHVDERPRALQHAARDIEVELLVDMDVGVAERARARRHRDRGQDRHAMPLCAAPFHRRRLLPRDTDLSPSCAMGR